MKCEARGVGVLSVRPGSRCVKCEARGVGV